MSLVFAAITPHPPILIPEIGKANLDQVAKTKAALEELEQNLYAAKPDVLMVISPHGELAADSFTINLADHYHINFENFGNFSVKMDFKGETVLMVAAKELLSQKIPAGVISNPQLDHGIGVPLYYLARHLPEVSLVPIYFSFLDNISHFEFGKGLKEIIADSNKRIAVIASGDMSHCLSKNAPAPFNPAGKKFDEKIIQLLEKNDSQSIVNFDPQLVENAAQCGLRSVLILLGILNGVNYSTEILSYEAPFGVGYLVANFKLN